MNRARVEELIVNIQKRQDALIEEIRVHEREEIALQELEKEMKASEAFDPYDLEAVRAERQRHSTEKERLMLAHEKEDEMREAHNELFTCLTNVINSRQQLLDNVDGHTSVLANHPDLLNFLAKKQISLEEMLTQKLESLAQETPSSKNVNKKSIALTK